MRVTSQQLRQFVVSQDGVLDPYILAENVALFNADGTPLEGLVEGADASALVWRGPWVENTAYKKFDVVSYDPGSDPGVYIFNENVSDPSYLFETYPLDGLLTEDSFPVSMVIDDSVSRSDNLSGSDNPFRAYGIRIAEAGQLHLSTAPDDTPRDMMAALFRLDEDGETWTSVASGDDEAGSMHPAINTAVTPGTYLFAFTIFGGDNPDAYGTSTLTLGESNTAVLGTWDTASFPVDSVTRFVAEGGGSRLPVGGADGEFLAKASAADGDAEWVPAPTGGGSGDSERMRWRGEYDDATLYVENDVIKTESAIWIAPGSILGLTPGVAADNADLFVNREVQIKESDRFNSTEDVLFEIKPGSSQYRDNDIGSGHGAVIYIDKSASTSGKQLIITPIERAGDSESLDVSAYYEPDFYRPGSSGSLDNAAVDIQTPLVLSIEDGSQDLIFHIYFGSAGVDGSFYARVNDATDLNGPPIYTSEWELLYGDTGGGAAVAAPVVTALPSSPVDGDEVIFQNTAMAALGVAWHLRYRAGASGAYKWEFVGGGEMRFANDNQVLGTAQGASGLVTSGWVWGADSSFTLPLAGDYEISYRVFLQRNNATAVVWGSLAFAGVVDNGFEMKRAPILDSWLFIPFSTKGVHTGAAAGETVRPVTKAGSEDGAGGGGGTGGTYGHRVFYRPIRVG